MRHDAEGSVSEAQKPLVKTGLDVRAAVAGCAPTAAFGCGTLLPMVNFSGRVRRWREDRPGGLAVVDIPEHLVADLGGRRQMRVSGSLNDAAFTGSTMLVAGGGLCVGVSKTALKSANASVGDEVRLSIAVATS